MTEPAKPLRSRRSAVGLQECPSCTKEHPPSLFKGDICIFCASRSLKTPEQQDDAPVDRAAELRERLKGTVQREEARRSAKERIKEKQKEQEAQGTTAQEELALKELAERELARRFLLPFVQRFNDEYQAGWVHKDICRRLEDFSLAVAERRSPRLMLMMPPRTGKSLLASQMFPAWHLGHYPDHEFITTSYSADLAVGFSRKVREIMRAKAYQALYPEIRLSKDSQRADHWQIAEKSGGLVAAGVGGSITGRGAHILVIDDPFRNRDDADSETVRTTVKNWYTSTAYTRLAPGGGVLCIATRWHDDDLLGWLEYLSEKGEGDRWEIIRYPAIAEEDEPYRKKGEALHPERFDLEALERIKRAVGPRDWSALYQQKPVPDSGSFFTRDMFAMYDAVDMPAYNDMTYYTAWDLAIGQREHNDETYGVTVGMDRHRKLWVVDIRHGRWDSEQIVDAILDTYDTWRSELTGIERGHIEMAIGPYLEQEINRRRLTAMAIELLKPGRRDKQARARPIQAMMQRKQVLYRNGCEATQGLINQMLRFPSGVHDDGCFVAGTMIDTAHGRMAIEQVKVGDLVYTPSGLKPVTAAGFTGVREVFELLMNGEVVLRGTGNHPIFSFTRGFISFDNIKWHDELIIRESSCRTWLRLKLMGLFFGVTQSPSIGSIESIFRRTLLTARRLFTYTGTCGKRLMGQSQKAMKSIILTTTPLTMSLAIWPASRLLSTNVSTPQATPSDPGQRSSWSTWTQSGTWQPSGTGVRKAGRGTSSTARLLGRLGRAITRGLPASIAVRVLRQTRCTAKRVFAALVAGLKPGPGGISAEAGISVCHPQSQGSASFARVFTSPLSAHGVRFVPKNAGTMRRVYGAEVRSTGLHLPVYNLSVSDEPFYFANGVLVHNCDAMAWIGQLISSMTPLQEAIEPKKTGWRDKLLRQVGRSSSSVTGHMSA